MENKDIKSILEGAVEQEIPSSQIDLLPAIRASLAAGQQFQQGEKMNTITSRRIQRLAWTTLTIAALMTIALITPQGRAFAQTILQFFTRSDSNSFPLQPSQIANHPEDESVPTAVPPASLISVAAAEARAGFDAGTSDRDEGELGGHQECVGQDQRQRDEEGETTRFGVH